MRSLVLKAQSGRKPQQLLCLGAHCDDIDIGCGGTLLKLLERNPRTQVTWVVLASDPVRERELRASARRFLRRAAKATVLVHRFRDGFFPALYPQIKEVFESLKQLPDPDMIFTHHRADFHQDHRIVAELTWNTFRNHLILEYEIPKYEGGLLTPSAYVGLTPAQVERKIAILWQSYKTQRAKRWFTADTFRAMLRLRGLEAAANSGWAEGFHVSKFLLE
ncbi:MAG TPA: PIG-L deacetylase family protein [Steroidobacteraceae bacterium]|jgi:LmbE family N-acetylglucosaminyl deacetylase